MGRVIFFSGAGLSADSGLGVFRGSGGLWNKYDVNKVCNYFTWRENYDLVHEFYNKRRLEYAKASPNEMHKTIAMLQKNYGKDNVIVITQNIDNLLELAGCSKVLHVHGRINYMYCIKCEAEFYIEGEFQGSSCERCNGKFFKPSVVFFGEQAPNYSPMYETITGLNDKDMIAVIGTEGSVVPIGSIVGSKTSGIKGQRLLCNLEPSAYLNEDDFHVVMYEKAVDAAPKVLKYAENILKGDS